MTPRRPDALECARQARRSMALVRQRLANPRPEVLDNCVPHLRVAIDAMTYLQGLLSRPGDTDARARGPLWREVKELRSELALVNALMQHAAVFYANLSELLLPVHEPVRYEATGVVAARPAPRLQLEG